MTVWPNGLHIFKALVIHILSPMVCVGVCLLTLTNKHFNINFLWQLKITKTVNVAGYDIDPLMSC